MESIDNRGEGGGRISPDNQKELNVTFLGLYCVFAVANLVLIAKFANKNELLHLFVMLTSLLALCCKVSQTPDLIFL